MIKRIEIAFDIEDIVYAKMDMDQIPRMVTGLLIYKTSILYKTNSQYGEDYYYDFELSKERDILKATSN